MIHTHTLTSLECECETNEKWVNEQNESTSEQSINHRAILNSIFWMHDIVIMDQINLHTHTHIESPFIEALHDFLSECNTISCFYPRTFTHSIWKLFEENNRMSLWMRLRDVQMWMCLSKNPFFEIKIYEHCMCLFVCVFLHWIFKYFIVFFTFVRRLKLRLFAFTLFFISENRFKSTLVFHFDQIIFLLVANPIHSNRINAQMNFI